MMESFQSRQVAHKIWLSNLMNGKFVFTQGEFTPNYVEVNGKSVSRVNVIATVTEVYVSEDASYASVTIDDHTGVARVKAFKEEAGMLTSLKAGDSVLVIARVKAYQGEVYLAPEIVRVLESLNWELVRSMELVEAYGKPELQRERIPVQDALVVNASGGQQQVMQSSVQVSRPSEEVKQKILAVVAAHDEVGCDILQLKGALGLSEEVLESAVKSLLLEGEVYENKPGFYKVI